MTDRRLIESLEPRRLLAAQPIDLVSIDGFLVRDMQWMNQPVQTIAGQFVAQFNGLGNTPEQQLDNARALINSPLVQVDTHLGNDGTFRLLTDPSVTYEQLNAHLSQFRQLDFVEPDFLYRLQQVFPNDSNWTSLWGLHNTGQSGGTVDVDIDAPEAWRLTTGSVANPVVIAVIDSGLNYNHPDLQGVRWTNPLEIPGDGIDNDGNGFIDDTGGWDYWGNGTTAGTDDNDPLDANSHGSHVSGTIAARTNNTTGIAGINWNARILPLKIGGSGSSVSGSDGILAHNYATAMRQRGENVRVINNSWGGGGFSSAFDTAINNATNAGILVVSAAGNNNSTTVFYPAGYTNSLSVGNITRTGARSGTSNYGSSWVQLAAPGDTIRSTVLGTSYGDYTGTSMASPHVAGVAALAFALKPNATVTQVRNAILQGVDVNPAQASLWSTSGRLNAFNTLQRIALLDAPTAPNLLASSDTGISTTDRITNAQALTVTGTAPWQSTARVYVDGVESGSAVIGDAGTFSIDLASIAEGNRQIRLAFSYPSGTSPQSSVLNVTVDRTAPTAQLSSTAEASQTPPSSLNISFSEPVFGLSLGNFSLTRNGLPISLAGATLSPAGGNSFTLGGLAAITALPGVYQLTLSGAGATDTAGNTVGSLTGESFRVYKLGDMNGDGAVNNLDIAPFVSALTSPSTFASENPWINPILSGDVNLDGALNNLDIAPFVSLLTGSRPQLQTTPPTSEPVRSPARVPARDGLFSDEPVAGGSARATTLVLA